jgi:hypothetical protein
MKEFASQIYQAVASGRLSEPLQPLEEDQRLKA